MIVGYKRPCVVKGTEARDAFIWTVLVKINATIADPTDEILYRNRCIAIQDSIQLIMNVRYLIRQATVFTTGDAAREVLIYYSC